MNDEYVHECILGEDPGTATFKFRNIFMAMEHNYLCAVCRAKKAVIQTWNGILQPCWDCQKRGYLLKKLNWFEKLWIKHGPS